MMFPDDSNGVIPSSLPEIMEISIEDRSLVKVNFKDGNLFVEAPKRPLLTSPVQIWWASPTIARISSGALELRLDMQTGEIKTGQDYALTMSQSSDKYIRVKLELTKDGAVRQLHYRTLLFGGLYDTPPFPGLFDDSRPSYPGHTRFLLRNLELEEPRHISPSGSLSDCIDERDPRRSLKR